MREAELFVLADQGFSNVLAQVEDRWDMRVPSTPEWTVRDLVEHVTGNNRSLTAALSGETVAREMGEDVAADWVDSAEAAERAANACTAASDPAIMPPVATTVGDALSVQTADRLIHGWDLANALGLAKPMNVGLVQVVYDFLRPRANDLRALGIFGPEVAVERDAPLPDRLLALTGRDPGTEHHEDPDASRRIEEIHRSS